MKKAISVSRDRMLELEVSSTAELSVRPLQNSELLYFAGLVQEYVSPYYPETEQSYPYDLADSHFQGFDPYGLITLSRTIWSVRVASQTVGFFVASIKRGGSIKLGPAVIAPDFREKGIGSGVMTLLTRLYSRTGFRKLYLTVPQTNNDALRLVLGAGFTKEAILRRHYSTDHNELVFGKLLQEQGENLISTLFSSDPMRLSSDPEFPLQRFISMWIEPYYEDIDYGFIRNLIMASMRSPAEDYRLKNRKIFYKMDDNNRMTALLIASMKRGGAVKCGPVGGNAADLLDLVREAQEFYRQRARRKMYIIAAGDQQETVSKLKREGFCVEGELIEPYRASKNMLVISNVWE